MACQRLFLQSVKVCSGVCRGAAWKSSLNLTKVARAKTMPLFRRQFSYTTAVMQDRLYSEEHEWVLLDESKENATIGISEHAQELLGDIVYVELPPVGTQLTTGDAFGVVESVKAASDLYAMADAEVKEVNETLEQSPELINSDPLNEGWMLKVKLNNPDQLNNLMTEEAYQNFIKDAE